MKNLLTLFLINLIALTTLAQAPQKFAYQSVIRNAGNQLVANQSVGMKISILQGSANGAAVYAETHSPLTNANGLATLEIGGGTVLSGNFATINWANGPYFVKAETDVNGGSNYTITSTTQLLSVPYALYAANAGSIAGGGIFISSVSSTGDTLYLSNGQTFISGTTNNLVLPTITTNAVVGITSNSATFGGFINNANGNQIMERGIVYSTSPNPTINSNKIIMGSGIGVFDTVSALGYQYPHLLNSNTTYYVRAYAVTENNISAYGNEVSFSTLAVGQTGPGGGIVFFNKGNANGGWQYLEAAANDQSTGIAWGCMGTSIPGTQLTIGSGEPNTNLIVSGCNDASFAAKLCDDLSLGGQTDWFLPSRDELNLMYKNLHANNQGDFTPGSYWSSTENDYDIEYNSAWIFSLYVGSASSWVGKGGAFYVRAVRAF